MGKTIHEWPCEVVLKRMTLIKVMLRHILGGSYNGRCAVRRGQVTLYGKIWFIYALRVGGVEKIRNLYVVVTCESRMDMAAVIFLNLVNETYNCNIIYSSYSVCSIMTPSFVDYPSPSIANSPSTNDSVKGENKTGFFQFFLYFFNRLFEFIYEMIEFSPVLAY
jgi:hypothetical protein